MTESMPPDLEQARQFHRSIMTKILDKACSDPQWRQQLIDEPEVAMRESGFPEVGQILEAMQATKQGAEGTSDMAAAEVEGHSLVSGYAAGTPQMGHTDSISSSGSSFSIAPSTTAPINRYCYSYSLYWA